MFILLICVMLSSFQSDNVVNQREKVKLSPHVICFEARQVFKIVCKYFYLIVIIFLK